MNLQALLEQVKTGDISLEQAGGRIRSRENSGADRWDFAAHP